MTEDGRMIELEEQRIGRNKETIVNNAYINSGEYKRKYDFISKTGIMKMKHR